MKVYTVQMDNTLILATHKVSDAVKEFINCCEQTGTPQENIKTEREIKRELRNNRNVYGEHVILHSWINN